ncbi:carbon storage regulator [Legionella sp.]|uniref:carbon storage regulator n=1 Tax=Legionella sp. TaxID=459 RepID=UPI000CC773DB|nr:carbon storage regulator [Legionella sp.]PJE14684.1 MAG: carbon storage regulator [Legionella sp.]
MEIIKLNFEEKLIITMKSICITLAPFKTDEPGNCKFGVDAPRTISVNREEIYYQKQRKTEQSST